MLARRIAAVVLVLLVVGAFTYRDFGFGGRSGTRSVTVHTRGGAGNNEADMIFGGDADALTAAGKQACRPKRNWFESVVGTNPGPATILIDDITPMGESHFTLACRDDSLFNPA